MRRSRLPEIVVWAVALALVVVLGVMHRRESRQQAYVSQMRDGLRSFAVAQESFLYDFGMYAADVVALEARGFVLDSAVTIEVREATASGWGAVASHLYTPRRCYLFVRAAAPVGGATQDGSLECD